MNVCMVSSLIIVQLLIPKTLALDAYFPFQKCFKWLHHIKARNQYYYLSYKILIQSLDYI